MFDDTNHTIITDHNDPAIEGDDIDVADVLTDEQLADGGLVPVKSYMRTTKSKAALRQEKKRQADEDRGIKKAGFDLPDNDEARNTVRAVAKSLVEGSVSPQELLMAVTPADDQDQAVETRVRVCRTVLTQGGIRAWLLRRLL